MQADRIFALATPPGRSGVAVLRVSGEGSRDCLMPLCGVLPENGRSLRLLRDGDGEVIDQALVLVFPKGASFTGEEVVELQVHGSAAVIKKLLAWLSATAGCRQAEAGEFTRRALHNGRLDFAQIEGLADLIDAETEAQRRQSVRVMTGELGRKVAFWRAQLLEVSGLVAAAIDFADEDIPKDHRDRIVDVLDQLCGELERESNGSRIAERIRDGFEVAIVGRPNVGKSTLLNRLAGREAAMTSSIAGTTRDVIEVRMDLAGFPVTLLDTAGIREAQDELEMMGIERAKARAAQADVRVHLLEQPDEAMMVQEGDIVLRAKADLGFGEGAAVSGLTGEGIDLMLAMLTARLDAIAAGVGTATHQRHRQEMAAALGHLRKAVVLTLAEGQFEDLVAEELRVALRAINSLVAPVDADEVLGWVFSRFCIGK